MCRASDDKAKNNAKKCLGCSSFFSILLSPLQRYNSVGGTYTIDTDSADWTVAQIAKTGLRRLLVSMLGRLTRSESLTRFWMEAVATRRDVVSTLLSQIHSLQHLV